MFDTNYREYEQLFCHFEMVIRRNNTFVLVVTNLQALKTINNLIEYVFLGLKSTSTLYEKGTSL